MKNKIIIVITMMLFACLSLCACSNASKVILPDYSHLEAKEKDTNVKEEDVQAYIDGFQAAFATSESVTSGVVEKGDSIHIVYTGTIDGVAFNGGSTGDAGTDIVVGSSGYVDGFDDGLIGASVGSTVDVPVTFPENYQSESLAGKDAVFHVTIESKKEQTLPELNDELVTNHSQEFLNTQINTVEEFKEYISKQLEETSFTNAIMEELLSNAEIEINPKDEKYIQLYEYYKKVIESWAEYYSMQPDDYATSIGYENMEDYVASQTEDSYNEVLLINALFDDMGLTVTEEDIDKALYDYIAKNNYGEVYTVDSFKEAVDDIWLYVFETDVKKSMIIEKFKEDTVPVTETSTN